MRLKKLLLPSFAGILLLCPIFCAASAESLTPPETGGQSLKDSLKGKQCYLFSYFTDKNNNRNGLHFAWSSDGYRWTAIGPEHSFLKSDYGSWGTEKKMRDPFIMQGPDGLYHCLWTINWDAPLIGHASSKDFIHWSRQDYPEVMKGLEARNCWAPEMIWDEENKEYLIFWASTIKENGDWKTEEGFKYDHRMYCTTTRDFKTYTPARLFFDPGHNVIDATIRKVGNKFYMIYKDEREIPVPQKNLLVAVSDHAAGPYQKLSGVPFTKNWVEGAATLPLPDGSFLVYMEAYRVHHYEAKLTRDFMDFQDVSDKISFPLGVKHGSVIKVPGETVLSLITEQERAARAEQENSGADLQLLPETPVKATLTADLSQGKKISDLLFGIFFEDINYAADGGLYAEMIQNRSFEYSPEDTGGRDTTWNALKSWKLVKTNGAGASLKIIGKEPLHANNPHYAVLQVTNPGDGAGISNEGFDGIGVRKGEKYRFSVFAKSLSGKKSVLKVRIVDGNGNPLADAQTSSLSRKWKKYALELVPGADDNSARLEILLENKGKVALDMVSLFPENTFKSRPFGLRADLAQTIADLRPRFVRFPGGCLVHGDGVDNMYRWKNTVGPPEQRKGQRNIWNYHQSAGLGYFEYFQFCEDIGAVPVPVVPAAVSCQNSSDGGQKGLPQEEMDDYLQEILDLIEYANGAPSTPWGKVRAEAGHPAPFNLKYIGIGNEERISDLFEENFTYLYKAVREKHPEITVIGTAGPFSNGTDYEEGWKMAEKLGIEVMDEHYYQPPGWFVHNQDFYDKYPRNRSKVYLGEYASWGNTLNNALAEAAYMTALERNGDVVLMASYAPLLAKEKHTQWSTDLIFFNNTEIKPTVNYQVQKLFSLNSGDEYLTNTLETNIKDEAVRKRMAVTVVRDSKTGDVVLKMVNLLPVPAVTSVNMENSGEMAPKAVMTVLSGMPGDRNLKPVTSEIEVKNKFQYTMPAYSLTVIRIKGLPEVKKTER